MAVHEARVRTFDDVTKIATVVIPGPYGMEPIEAAPFIRQAINSAVVETLSVGDRVLVVMNENEPPEWISVSADRADRGHWNSAWGVVANFPLLSPTTIAITTSVAITGNLNITLQAGRRYRIVAQTRAMTVVTAASGTTLQLFNGVTQIVLTGAGNQHTNAPLSNYGFAHGEFFIDGAGQTYTQLHFKMQGSNQTVYTDFPSAFYVEDVGPLVRDDVGQPNPSSSVSLVFADDVENYGGGYEPATVTLFGPIVVCQGLIKRSTGAVAFTSGVMCSIPAGYRPGSINLFYTLSSAGACRIDITPAGSLSLSTSPAVSLAAGAWVTIQFTWVL